MQRQRVAGTTLFSVGRYHVNMTDITSYLSQDFEPPRIYPVVVSYQDSQPGPSRR